MTEMRQWSEYPLKCLPTAQTCAVDSLDLKSDKCNYGNVDRPFVANLIVPNRVELLWRTT